MTVAPLPVPPPRAFRQESAKIFVRGLAVEAQIGAYDHELGRTQPLVFDVELDVSMSEPKQLSEVASNGPLTAAREDSPRPATGISSEPATQVPCCDAKLDRTVITLSLSLYHAS